MSIETPKVEENTPVVNKPVESTTTPAESATKTHHEPEVKQFTLGTTAPPEADETPTTTSATPAAATTESAKHEALVEATPATEGVLGYKAPGLLKQFRFVKHFFWLSEEPLSRDALDSYVKTEKHEGHHNAAWAQETGKGVLFYAKRAEDKAAPAGLINIAEATAVTKIGLTDFSFKLHGHNHKFEAASEAERDSWVVALQKIVEESKDLKADITGRDSYKKTVEGYASTPAVIGASTAAATPKKSLDVNTATAAHTKETAPIKADTSSESSAEDAAAKHEKKERKEAEKQAKKERSQSRKRNSVFGLFGKKDEDKTEKKVEKEHEKEVKKHEHEVIKEEKKAEAEHKKEVKKHEHEVIKEEKKAEAEHKKEEAKAEHDHHKAKEAAETAAVAAAPAAVAASHEKKEEKRAEPKTTEEVTTPTDKKAKRASVFGGFFGKNKITSPTTEKSEKEVGPQVPAKDETSAVSETAPKLDEPIHTKPIDTAAVTAPVDHAETGATPLSATEAPKTGEATPFTEATTTPRTEKKSFLAGLIKKQDKKEEPRHETKTNEEAIKEATPVTAATETPAIATDGTTEVPAATEAEAPVSERPAREKRRTSLFGSLGTLKRKSEKSPAPESSAATSEEIKTESKREKSPMPSKLGGLFRKPSRATKPEPSAEHGKSDVVKPETLTETPEITTGLTGTETPANATIGEPKAATETAAHVVPDSEHNTFHDAVTANPTEVKSTA